MYSMTVYHLRSSTTVHLLCVCSQSSKKFCELLTFTVGQIGNLVEKCYY